MKANFLLVILAFFYSNSYAQIGFEKGYLINNDNLRIECFIKNIEWKNNPKEFEYRLTENGSTATATTDDVKEFGISGYSRYVKADTKIDRSSMELLTLSADRNPIWSQERLFLKVLVEGKATLYYFEGDGLMWFFYSVSDTGITQLVYKEYFVNFPKDHYSYNDEIAVNNTFHLQLWVYVRCANTSQGQIEKLRYTKSDLIKYFKKYNECNGKPLVDYSKKPGINSFHLWIRPGINYSFLSILNSVNPGSNVDFNNQLNFRISLESEFILPFNKNKWSLLFEPAYQYFISEKQKDTKRITVDFKSIEFPVGIRYYLYLNDKNTQNL